MRTVLHKMQLLKDEMIPCHSFIDKKTYLLANCCGLTWIKHLQKVRFLEKVSLQQAESHHPVADYSNITCQQVLATMETMFIMPYVYTMFNKWKVYQCINMD